MRRPAKYALVGCGTVVGLVVLAVAAILVLVAIRDRPPDVPDDFVAPTSLPAPTATPPDDALFFDSDRTGNFEVYRTTTRGGPATQLTRLPGWDAWWPRLSPDRTHILFYRTPAGVHDLDFGKTHLWVMNADGSHEVELRPPGLDGWAQQGHAEWSPDGTQLVMFGGKRSNPQIFVTDATGQDPRRLTDRGGTNIDPSFSPDGGTVAFVGCPHTICLPGDYEIYLIPSRGGSAKRLTDDGFRDQDPYFSPDGQRIAWLTQTSARPRPTGSWNIRIADADGSGLRRVTDDANINSKPEWSRDGDVIFFHRLELGVADGFSVFAVNADGSGLREITKDQPGVNEFPSD